MREVVTSQKYGVVSVLGKGIRQPAALTGAWGFEPLTNLIYLFFARGCTVTKEQPFVQNVEIKLFVSSTL